MKKSPITRTLDDKSRNTTGVALQETLVDMIDLALLAKQAHWNVVGSNFRSAHLQLDELVATARRYADQVAERASAIGVSPTGTAAAVAKDSGLPDYPTGWQTDKVTIEHIAATLGTVAERLRPRIERTESSDPVTQDLLIAIAGDIEQAHWMWQAQLAG